MGKRILYLGMQPGRSVCRLVKQKVDRWMESELSPLVPGPTEYTVRIEREASSSVYHCALEIRIGSWRGKAAEIGRTAELAISNALRAMRFPRSPPPLKETCSGRAA